MRFFHCCELDISFAIQTDLEEAKAQEIAKLQEALHAMQLQVEEAKSMVIKEREAARKAIEEAPPVIKETPVIIQDAEKINALNAEVDKLKVGVLLVEIFKNGANPFWFLCCSMCFYIVMGT